jgi:choline kinase
MRPKSARVIEGVITFGLAGPRDIIPGVMPTLLVMAAGLGSRYGGFKQVDRVGPSGEMLLEYAVFDARRAGVRRVVFIIRNELADAFASLRRGLPADLDVSSVFQEAGRLPSWFVPPARRKPWGTVHAVLSARDAIDTPFAAVNADDFYGAAAYRLAVSASDAAASAGSSAVIGLPLASTLSEHGPVVRGICQTAGEWLTGLDEVYGIERAADGARGTVAVRTFTSAATDAITPRHERSLTGHELASMNFWVFPPAIFDRLEERFHVFLRHRGSDPSAELPLPEAAHELIQTGAIRVRAIEAPGPWFGLTHVDDRPKVVAGLRALHERGVYPDPLWRQ